MSQQYIWPSQDAAVPVGGATAANQVLEIASLDAIEASAASIDAKLTAPLTTSEEKSTTGTASNVAASVTVVTLLAANSARDNATIYNDSTSNLYVKLGSAASSTSFTVLMLPGAYYELPIQRMYTGIITGVWASATGNARVTELT
jgi:hypothetical protein